MRTQANKMYSDSITAHPLAVLALVPLVVVDVMLVQAAYIIYKLMYSGGVTFPVPPRWVVVSLFISSILWAGYMTIKAIYCVVTGQELSFIWVDSNVR